MRYESIADIFSANQRFRQIFVNTVTAISPEEIGAEAADEKWNVQRVVEHVSLVDAGIARICSKLLESARSAGGTNDGKFSLTEDFGVKAASIATGKLEAPDRVQPTGEITIEESLERLSQSTRALEQMRSALETVDLRGHTFPHPYFGELTAAEWLVVAGQHEARHTKQIERILAKIRQ